MLTTRHKILLARTVQRPVMLARRLTRRGATTTVRRRGLTWKLDLREGIDFAIWLQGRFEPSTVRALGELTRPGGNVIDIGANIGAHTLHLARSVGADGRVLACEPTAHAFARLVDNLDENPELAGRVDARQVMLLDRVDARVPDTVISSWPLDGSGDVHPTIRGLARGTEGARAVTLDDLVAEWGVDHVDLIKLDVDGYECEVLDGAKRTLAEHAPVIVSEIAPHAFAARDRDVTSLLERFEAAGYTLESMGHGRPIGKAEVNALKAKGVSENVIARPAS